ncbi:PREDICTED: uncharacterized protein At2g39795, mitochondrial-like [Camelina sativa]|uniref:Uncharacterized protein At2g39795, mitochondrial-like n=1 Tax=Camelina sativa TaxID=90675 RepID=A0ABM0YXV9_CAMSA|nr:PREDICTED: uncharacterized protein At2g39795, mitochondrial-like [Camelina sativa]
MALAWCAVRRSASKFASLCGGRVGVISTVVNRPSLALNPSQLRPFVSDSSHYPKVIDHFISEQTLILEIDSQIRFASQTNDMVNDEEATPGSLPFRIEDDGGKTVTLTRDYNGEHIKVVVGMPCESQQLPNTEWLSDDFKDVNHVLENAFYKYLETRLTKDTTNFLYEYMTTNKRRQLFWLKDVKKFLVDAS